MDNCKSCLYSNFLEDGSVFCDKVVLLYDKEVYIDADKVENSCPAHSSNFIEETRVYFNNKDVRKAEDSCGICGRRVNLYDISQYKYMEIQDELGNPSEKLVCKICDHKGRR